MNGVWTSLDEKNSYIGKQNICIYNNDLIINKISAITNNSPLPNIEKISADKVYELDEDFKKQGMEIFDPHGNIARTIREDLMNICFDASKEIEKITNALSLTYPGFMTSSKIFMDRLYTILTKKYIELSKQTQNYNIKDNLRRVIFEYFRDSRYWIFTPGSYTSAWEQQKKELVQLGFEDFIKQNEYKILRLIKMQEENSKKFELNEYKNGKRKLTDEELGIELNRLSKIKEDLDTKYADEKVLNEIDMIEKELADFEAKSAEEESMTR